MIVNVHFYCNIKSTCDQVKARRAAGERPVQAVPLRLQGASAAAQPDSSPKCERERERKREREIRRGRGTGEGEG